MARIQEKYIIDGLNKFRRFMGLKPIIVFLVFGPYFVLQFLKLEITYYTLQYLRTCNSIPLCLNPPINLFSKMTSIMLLNIERMKGTSANNEMKGILLLRSAL